MVIDAESTEKQYEQSALYETMLKLRPNFLPMNVRVMTEEQRLIYNEYVIQLLTNKLSRDEMAELLNVKKGSLNSYITRERLLHQQVVLKASNKSREIVEAKFQALDKSDHLEQLKKAMVIQQTTIAEGNRIVLSYMRKYKSDLNAMELAHLNKSLKS